MDRCNLSESVLQELEELEKLATKGPWTGFRTGILHGANWVVSNVSGEDGAIMSKEDAIFIAAFRNVVPDLLLAAKWVKWAEQTIDKASRDNDVWCEALTEMDELRTENERLRTEILKLKEGEKP